MNVDWTIEDEQAHPRAPKGSTGGGKFAAKPKPSKPMAKALGYDPKRNWGTGYGTPGGDKRVHLLQRALNRLGIHAGADGKPLADDGKLGPKTTAAVKAAQKRLGLAPDGHVTPALLARLLMAKKLPERGAAMLCERSYDFAPQDAGDGRTLEGYAAVFRTPTTIRDLQGDFEEVILPGAFKRSLTERTPVLQWDHGRDPSVGTAPIGDITDLREDDKGLFVRARLYDHASTERVRMAIKGKSIKGMSFRFGVPDKGDAWTRRDGKPDLREIRDADVHELGPVVFPAYRQTTVSVRDLVAQLGEDGYQQLVRDVGEYLRAAADLTDLVGQPAPERADGDDIGSKPSSGPVPAPPHLRQRLDEGALRVRGILR
jgi:HK97 family phage prohead protease